MIAPDTDTLVRAALAEDHGSGDVTSRAVVPESARARAVIRAKAFGVLAGLDVARAAFRAADSECELASDRRDGDHVEPGEVILRIHGNARAVLGAERAVFHGVELGQLSQDLLALGVEGFHRGYYV